MAMSLSLGATSFITLWSISKVPLEISSRPATILKVVDLPQPDGPTKTINSLSLICKSKSLTEYLSFPSYFL